MAVKNITVSDVSGVELPDEKHARIVITDHPELRGQPVELDVSIDEAAALQTGKIELVTMEIYEPNMPKRSVALDAAAFKTIFGKGVDTNALVTNGRTVALPAPGGVSSSRKRTAAGTGEKREYSSAQWAGVEHRGRVTETEAAWVRDNLDEANANRAREGQTPIDRSDPKMIKRYGF